MIRILLLLSALLILPAHSGEPKSVALVPNGVTGKWISNYAAVKGEKQELEVRSDGTTRFTRTFEDGEPIEVESRREDLRILDDIVLVTYHDGDFGIRYKMVLSGWQHQESGKQLSALYGTLFLYQNGTQFNGFPVSFRAAQTVNKPLNGDAASGAR